MRLSSTVLAIVVVVSVFGTIGVTALAGVWQTESDRVPRRIAEGVFEGSYDPADIRGSYSFADVEAAFDVPVVELARAFGVPEEHAAAFEAKELEEAFGEIGGYEVGTDTLRLFVALYTGLPHEPEETTGMPSSAFRVLRDRIDETGGDPQILESFAARRVATPPLVVDADGSFVAAPANDVPLASDPVPGGGPDTALAEDHVQAEDDETVRGRTTFADLLSWGLSREQIEATIGAPMPARPTLVRDFATEAGVSFSDLRTSLQALLDQR